MKEVSKERNHTLYVRCSGDQWYKVSMAALNLRIDKAELIRLADDHYLKTVVAPIYEKQ